MKTFLEIVNLDEGEKDSEKVVKDILKEMKKIGGSFTGNKNGPDGEFALSLEFYIRQGNIKSVIKLLDILNKIG